jgi:hypothetical protein
MAGRQPWYSRIQLPSGSVIALVRGMPWGVVIGFNRARGLRGIGIRDHRPDLVDQHRQSPQVADEARRHQLRFGLPEGQVLAWRTMGWPEWLPGWCAEQVGDTPVTTLFEHRSISAAFGVRLGGGREVVVKVRPDDGRAAACVEAQAMLARRGFPCPRPITPVMTIDGSAVHAEESRPGGTVLAGDSPTSPSATPRSSPG